MPTHLDFGQVIKGAYDETNQALQVKQIAGSLITEPYDSIDLTYVASGNGVGQVETVTYKLSGITQGVLTLTYDSSNRLQGVVKS